jgi:hypothetical protein
MAYQFHLDLSEIQRLLLPEPAAGESLSKRSVPVEQRGVKLGWALDFVRAVDKAVVDLWDRFDQHERAYEHLNWSGQIPEGEPPGIPRSQPIDGYFLQSTIIKPLTEHHKTALYELIPLDGLGPPTVFVSHAWGDALGMRPGTSLIDLTGGNHRISDSAACWIDLFVYNQHRPQDIATDMERIIGAIGTLVMPMSSEQALHRLWCIWEWICANRSGAEITLPEPAYSRYYFGKKRDWFETTFRSIAHAQTSNAEDHRQIMDEIVRTFGSVEAADRELRHLADRYFTHSEDAPWNKS